MRLAVFRRNRGFHYETGGLPTAKDCESPPGPVKILSRPLSVALDMSYGLDNQIIDPGDQLGRAEGDVICDEHLGGRLRTYDRAAG